MRKILFCFLSVHLKKYAYPLLQLVRPTMAQGSSSEYLVTGISIFRPYYQTTVATFDSLKYIVVETLKNELAQLALDF
jgi:hypothetical protein